MTDYGTDIAFSDVAPNVLSVSDSDAFLGTGEVEVTLSVNIADGELMLTPPANVPTVTVDVMNTPTVSQITITGSVDEVNTTLKELIFSPDPDFFSSSTTLTMTTDDQGNFPNSTPSTPDTDLIKITVNDPPAISFTMDTDSVEEAVASGFASVTLTRDTNGLASKVNVVLTHIDTVSEDFGAITSPIVVDFEAGDFTKTFTIPINNDNIVELDEQFSLEIMSVSNGPIGSMVPNGPIGTLDMMTITITEDLSDMAEITIEEVTALESDQLMYNVKLSNPVSGEVSVIASTIPGGTASSDDDFTASMETIIFDAGQTEKSFTVPVNDDEIVELDETVFAQITGLTIPVGYEGRIKINTLGGNQATGTITDNDTTTVSIENPTYTVNESTGKLDFKLKLTKAVDQDFTVTATVTNGTAEDADYTFPTQPLTIPAGALEATFSIAITKDDIVELDDVFTIDLIAVTPPTGAGYTGDITIDGANDTATVTITDDDSAVVTIEDVSSPETSNLQF